MKCIKCGGRVISMKHPEEEVDIDWRCRNDNKNCGAGVVYAEGLCWYWIDEIRPIRATPQGLLLIMNVEQI